MLIFTGDTHGDMVRFVENNMNDKDWTENDTLIICGDFGYIFMLAGIACFSLATLFQLITLPVEFNASRRAIAGMRESGVLHDDEVDAGKSVLFAAAMTYVAALATSLLSLLRLILIARNRRD